ncbi:hypothetical protein [Amycolatopsis sp. CA-126428]|uniref:hypothetical protein n=1 Tax=Amycolatopsis sp. CA-126428 TaxID=2073158 RepID=UPI000CCFD982|nr:hypothetical protein [Amycolatopsis sp. CA-126428]
MNGPEHYARAEECFAESDRIGPSHEDAGLWLDLGIGHALLAIAAALTPPTEPTPAEKAAFTEWGPA